MLHLLLVSGLLAGALFWGTCDPWETSLDEDHPLETVVLTLNESCKERALRRIGSSVLRLLRLDRTPEFPAEMTSPLHRAWAEEAATLPALSAGGQHFNLSSNETVLSRKGSCVQISHHITLADLGWQSWVLHPTSFLFTECVGCHCHQKEEGPPLALWIQECTPEPPKLQADRDSKQIRCCRPHRTSVSFVFLKEDGSLLVQLVRLVHNCHCQP